METLGITGHMSQFLTESQFAPTILARWHWKKETDHRSGACRRLVGGQEPGSLREALLRRRREGEEEAIGLGVPVSELQQLGKPEWDDFKGAAP